MTGKIMANGESVETELPCTIQVFLERVNMLPRSVVVEWNGEAVPPSRFTTIELHEGDKLEIVKIVAGG